LNLAPYFLTATIAVLRQSPDIVYISKPTPATVMAGMLKWFKQTPIVVDLDDLGSEVMRREGRSAAAWRLVAACERFTEKQATALVVVSRLLEHELTSRFRGDKRVVRIPNGVDPREFTPTSPKPGRRPRLIFFGVLSQPNIVGAVLAALPDVIRRVGSDAVQLDILGDGPTRAGLEHQADELGLAGNVHFRGWVTFQQLHHHVAVGDIGLCVVPDERSVAAASNQKLFQYQALELAPVVTAVGDLPEYVDGGEAGVVVPAGDSDALAEVLAELLTNSQRRRRLARQARAVAETRYTWSAQASALEQVFEEVIVGPKPNPQGAQPAENHVP